MIIKISVSDNSKRPVKHEFCASATLRDLKSVVYEMMGVLDIESQLLHGFPPKVLSGADDDQLIKFGLTHGDQITVKVDMDKRSAYLKLTEEMGIDKNIVREAMHILPSSDADILSEVCQQLKENLFGSPVGDEYGGLERKIIEADNSCLFNAIGYLSAEGDSPLSPIFYRKIVAQAVVSDADRYSESLLGKPPQQYADWILDSNKWGGEIELVILSEYLKVEIAVVNISTCAVIVYGEGAGHANRMYLLYDGVHYDAVVKKEANGVSTLFRPDDAVSYANAIALAAELQRKKQYVSLSGNDLQCKVCFAVLRGQQQAIEHATQTGHQNFGQLNS